MRIPSLVLDELKSLGQRLVSTQIPQTLAAAEIDAIVRRVDPEWNRTADELAIFETESRKRIAFLENEIAQVETKLTELQAARDAAAGHMSALANAETEAANKSGISPAAIASVTNDARNQIGAAVAPFNEIAAIAESLVATAKAKLAALAAEPAAVVATAEPASAAVVVVEPSPAPTEG